MAATEMDFGMTPCTEGSPMIQNRTSVEDQFMIAELRLYKKKKKKVASLFPMPVLNQSPISAKMTILFGHDHQSFLSVLTSQTIIVF